jgi:MFS family permease
VTIFNVFSAPAFSLMQRLVPDDMRATTLAVIMFLVNLIGMGVGPQLVGVLSDAFMPRFGADSLRYAMLFTSVLALWAAFHFWRVGEAVSRDLALASPSVSLSA